MVVGVSTLLLTALVAIAGYLLLLWHRTRHYWQNLGIPCEEPHLLLGSLGGLRTERSFNDVWIHYYKKFRLSGPFAGFYWFQRPAVFVLEPSLAKLILIKDFNKFTDRGFFHNPEDDPLSGQLFLLDGHKWRSMRNKLSSTFTSGKMKYMCPTVVRVSHEFTDVFGQMVDKSPIVEVKELLARYTTDVIGTCAFGIDCSSLKDPEAEFRLMGRRALTEQRHGSFGIGFLNSFPRLSRKLHLKMTAEPIEQFFMRIVRETVKFREQNQIRRNDFMDQLIDLKNNQIIKSEAGDNINLTIEEIAAQAFVFFAAGFETSSTTMGFALYELAQHPEIQQRAREECQEVIQRYNGELTYESMKDLVYLDQVISETLRLYTVLPVLNRECLEDYVVPDNPKYVIKKGMPILIPAGPMHRDERFYPNPNVFNPDNFSAERVKSRDSVEWLPFGDGPRNCIGMRFGQMQARVGMAMLLKDFKFSVCDETTIPMTYNMESFLIASATGISLRVERV
ncbi:probable cytochrome P450 6a21 [Drosophila subobscura]|uniref:probable cytochrome P450 6a21 n=1 Tax=Drosophila subobscura TaxID=7241 RepID=UPI00155B0240|nr:probable cytochrome P450 6a21 [Drosophila subobscura]XP_034652024.1 probable cytochrome P450 6a21 [Drosophila subobscura]